MGERPEACANRNDYGAQEISGLAVEVQTAGRATIIHLGKAPVNARVENAARPASWAELTEDTAQSGSLGMGQEHMIVDKLPVGSAVLFQVESRDDDNLWLLAFAPILV